MAKDDHGTRKPSIHGMSGSASSTSRPWSPKVPMESNVYDVFFSIFFDDQKKEWWCFPRIYGSSSSLSCVSMGIAVLAPFFYQCVICYLGFKPQFLHRVMLPGEDPGILWGYGRYPVLEHTLFGGELPTNRGCGFVHPSDWHGISRVNPLITGVITHWATK